MGVVFGLGGLLLMPVRAATGGPARGILAQRRRRRLPGPRPHVHRLPSVRLGLGPRPRETAMTLSPLEPAVATILAVMVVCERLPAAGEHRAVGARSQVSLLPQLFYLLDLAGPPATGHAVGNLRGLPEPGDRFGETLVEADRSDVREQGVQAGAVGL